MEVTPFPPKLGKCFDSTALRDGNGITRAVLARARHPTCRIAVSITLSSRRDAFSARFAASTRMMPLEMGPHCTHAPVITLPLATR